VSFEHFGVISQGKFGIQKKSKEKESTQRIMVQDDSLRLLKKEKSRERAEPTTAKSEVEG
jgi:hypothetical protein